MRKGFFSSFSLQLSGSKKRIEGVSSGERGDEEAGRSGEYRVNTHRWRWCIGMLKMRGAPLLVGLDMMCDAAAAAMM